VESGESPKYAWVGPWGNLGGATAGQPAICERTDASDAIAQDNAHRQIVARATMIKPYAAEVQASKVLRPAGV
jgi:hypothetical protein